MIGNRWLSPDGTIEKVVLRAGNGGELKPTENARCAIVVSECSENVAIYADEMTHTIGDSSSEFERMLDRILMHMRRGERAQITLTSNRTFTVELMDFTAAKLIFECNVREKFAMALAHKEKGIELFHAHNYIEASHRFGKAIKLLCLVPIEVDEPPQMRDGVQIAEIAQTQVIVYNNLALCFMKCDRFETAMEVCRKILELDGDNVKALYKYGVCSMEVHAYEEARDSLMKVMELEPDNKAAEGKLRMARAKVAESTKESDAIVRRMFSQ